MNMICSLKYAFCSLLLLAALPLFAAEQPYTLKTFPNPSPAVIAFFQALDQFPLQTNAESPQPEKTYQCSKCFYIFSSERTLLEHKDEKHQKATRRASIVSTQTIQSPIQKKFHQRKPPRERVVRKNQCTTCFQQCASSHHLLIHIRSHTGEKPFYCEKCDKRFTSASGRNVHERGIHKFVRDGFSNKERR